MKLEGGACSTEYRLTDKTKHMVECRSSYIWFEKWLATISTVIDFCETLNSS